MLMENTPASRPRRFAMAIGLRADQLESYRALHADPWQGVLEALDRAHLRRFSIWHLELRPGEHLLFGHFNYEGSDFEADMRRMEADEETQAWWRETDPCQEPVPTAAEGERWVMLEELFFHDREDPEAPLMPPAGGFAAS